MEPTACGFWRIQTQTKENLIFSFSKWPFPKIWMNLAGPWILPGQLKIKTFLKTFQTRKAHFFKITCPSNQFFQNHFLPGLFFFGAFLILGLGSALALPFGSAFAAAGGFDTRRHGSNDSLAFSKGKTGGLAAGKVGFDPDPMPGMTPGLIWIVKETLPPLWPICPKEPNIWSKGFGSPKELDADPDPGDPSGSGKVSIGGGFWKALGTLVGEADSALPSAVLILKNILFLKIDKIKTNFGIFKKDSFSKIINKTCLKHFQVSPGL